MPAHVHAPVPAAPAARARDAEGSEGSLPLVLAGLFALGVLISGFTILRGGAPFDEGIVLQAARRVATGELPYRDFDWAYGPAQPYLLGASFDAFGTSLLGWRVIRVLCDAGVAVVVYVLVRRGASPRLALVAWLAAACAMAQPTSAAPTATALLLGLLALAVATPAPTPRGVVAAGVLTALAIAWRLDFGLYAGLAVSLALALEPRRPSDRARRLALFLATGAALAVLAYLPFLVATGPAELYASLLGDALADRDHWTLPFPLSYGGGFSAWPPAELAEKAKDVLDFYVPLLLVAGLAVGVAAAALARPRLAAPAALALLAFAACGLAYLLSRADELHTAPLLVTLSAALALLAARLLRPGAGGAAKAVGAACLAVLALMSLSGVLNRFSALVQPPALATIDLPAADGVKAPPEEAAALERTVRAVQRTVPPDRPIYTVTARSDLVRFNQPLIYVLAERDNPTPIDYGLQTGAAEQRRLVTRLRRARPAAVVRWLDPITTLREPNLRGRPSGSRTLDAYLEQEYRRASRFGDYELLLPRTPAG